MIRPARDPLAIGRVHDILDALVQTPKLFKAVAPLDGDRDGLCLALDVLCWVLGHESLFEDAFAAVEERLARLGVAMIQTEPKPERTD